MPTHTSAAAAAPTHPHTHTWCRSAVTPTHTHKWQRHPPTPTNTHTHAHTGTHAHNAGIGHALALRFAEQGCTVYATARRPESVGPVPDGVTVLALDVTSAASVRASLLALSCRDH
jgi:hypothetical protein